MRDEKISSLVAQADNGFRELVAFDEIITEISGRTAKLVAGKWTIEDFMSFFGPGEEREFNHALTELTVLLQEAKQHFKENGGTFTINFTSESKQTREMVSSFVLNALNRSMDRAPIVGRAVLIASESSFEVLFGQLARTIYAKNPAALPRSDHSFTLEELSNFSSVEEAREYLISQKIETLLRESLEEWNKWLKRTINVALEQIMSDWSVTREIFIRRNMLVHTNGKISERYLNEIRRAGGDISQLRLGDSLTPTVEYLRQSLQRLIALEVLLVFRVWSRLEKSELNNAASWLSGKLKFLVENSMLDAVCLIADSFESPQCHRRTKLDIEISGWTAHKARDGVSTVKRQVSAWDVSGLDKKYSFIKKLLLDELSAVELEGAIKEGIFSRFEASTSPLFTKNC